MTKKKCYCGFFVQHLELIGKLQELMAFKKSEHNRSNYRVSQKDRYDFPQQECSVLLTPEDIMPKNLVINVH